MSTFGNLEVEFLYPHFDAQGYLAHKKPPPPPRTIIGPWAQSYCRVLGRGGFGNLEVEFLHAHFEGHRLYLVQGLGIMLLLLLYARYRS